ncbi:hypothetical protein DLAC_10447 [Tieghemostelium lacteum]|uniref:Ankyrin repeat-containing protein n=1 Tax=Tieghemostelium lacteum TaxID=361077 RepID=A0A151Z5F5_TIELA|nr:hypothetical protein DLAC_10447 [Tieghemostelium lacteum]|eukprot:KYQ89203.1 hypothetical protein DLAC_10447 [Tieghemostelium lacteum]
MIEIIDNQLDLETIFWRVWRDKYLLNLILFHVKNHTIEFVSTSYFNLGNRVKISDVSSLRWICKHKAWPILKDILVNNRYLTMTKKAVIECIKICTCKETLKLLYQKRKDEMEIINLVECAAERNSLVALETFTEIGVPASNYAMDVALINGNIQAIEYLHTHRKHDGYSESLIIRNACISNSNRDKVFRLVIDKLSVDLSQLSIKFAQQENSKVLFGNFYQMNHENRELLMKYDLVAQKSLDSLISVMETKMIVESYSVRDLQCLIKTIYYCQGKDIPSQVQESLNNSTSGGGDGSLNDRDVHKKLIVDILCKIILFPHVLLYYKFNTICTRVAIKFRDFELITMLYSLFSKKKDKGDFNSFCLAIFKTSYNLMSVKFLNMIAHIPYNDYKSARILDASTDPIYPLENRVIHFDEERKNEIIQFFQTLIKSPNVTLGAGWVIPIKRLLLLGDKQTIFTVFNLPNFPVHMVKDPLYRPIIHSGIYNSMDIEKLEYFHQFFTANQCETTILFATMLIKKTANQCYLLKSNQMKFQFIEKFIKLCPINLGTHISMSIIVECLEFDFSQADQIKEIFEIVSKSSLDSSIHHAQLVNIFSELIFKKSIELSSIPLMDIFSKNDLYGWVKTHYIYIQPLTISNCPNIVDFHYHLLSKLEGIDSKEPLNREFLSTTLLLDYIPSNHLTTLIEGYSRYFTFCHSSQKNLVKHALGYANLSLLKFVNSNFPNFQFIHNEYLEFYSKNITLPSSSSLPSSTTNDTQWNLDMLLYLVENQRLYSMAKGWSNIFDYYLKSNNRVLIETVLAIFIKNSLYLGTVSTSGQPNLITFDQELRISNSAVGITLIHNLPISFEVLVENFRLFWWDERVLEHVALYEGKKYIQEDFTKLYAVYSAKKLNIIQKANATRKPCNLGDAIEKKDYNRLLVSGAFQQFVNVLKKERIYIRTRTVQLDSRSHRSLAKYATVDMLKLLRELEVHINYNSILPVIVKKGKLEVLKYLLGDNDIRKTLKALDIKTLIYKGHLQMIQYLYIHHESLIKLDDSQVTWQFNTTFTSGHLPIALFLLSRYPKHCYLSPTLIQDSLENGCVNVFKYLKSTNQLPKNVTLKTQSYRPILEFYLKK